MAQKRLIVSLAAFLLFSAITAPLSAMEPTENSSEQPADPSEQLMIQFTPVTKRDIRQAEQNRQSIATADQKVTEMLARTKDVLEEADEFIKEAERILNSTAPQVDASKPASPEFPAIRTLDHDLEDYLKTEKVNTNLFDDEAADKTPANSKPIEVIVEEAEFPAQPRFIPNSNLAPLQALPETPEVPAQLQEKPLIPALPQEDPAPAPIIEDNSRPQLYDDLGYYQAATANQQAIPGEARQPVQQLNQQQSQQQQPIKHIIEESMVKQILDNIMEHKVPMATAGAFGVVHYLYENEILANAVPVRSRQMCEFLHDYVLPTTREALAANLIQLLLPYLPYLRDHGVRSFSTGKYLASYVTTKILGTTALYLAKLVTQTEQGKKLLTHYKRLPKKTIETIEKVVPWINFARNVLVARSLAGYFD